jgi:hypothetical protein
MIEDGERMMRGDRRNGGEDEQRKARTRREQTATRHFPALSCGRSPHTSGVDGGTEYIDWRCAATTGRLNGKPRAVRRHRALEPAGAHAIKALVR